MRNLDTPPPARSGRGKHDWAALADGRWYEAEKGVDFEKALSFRQLPGQWASNHGKRMEDQGSHFKAETRLLPNGNVAFRISRVS